MIEVTCGKNRYSAEEVIEQYHDMLYRLAMIRINHSEDAKDVVQDTAVAEIDAQLPEIQRNRQQHQRVEIPPFFRGFQVKEKQKEDKECDAPSCIGEDTGNIRIFIHDDQVSCPIVTAHQTAQEKDCCIRPVFSPSIDVVEQTQQEGGQVCQKLYDVFSIIQNHIFPPSKMNFLRVLSTCNPGPPR